MSTPDSPRFAIVTGGTGREVRRRGADAMTVVVHHVGHPERAKEASESPVAAPLLFLVGEEQTGIVRPAPSEGPGAPDDIAEVVAGPARWFDDHVLSPDGGAA